jgi:hypothetical protein
MPSSDQATTILF